VSTIDPENIVTSFKKIEELATLLDTRENNEWMRLMKAPHFLHSQLNEVFRESNLQQVQQKIQLLLSEIESLQKIATHHRFLNGSAIKIWSALKCTHDSLTAFYKSLTNEKPSSHHD
jgi:hypothetical protein